MKNILFVISDYLPNKNGGTIRIEKLIKYLPESNFKNYVLTKRTADLKPDEVINDTQIYRTKPYDLPAIYQRFKKKIKRTKPNVTAASTPAQPAVESNDRLANLFFVPDVDIFWAIFSFWYAKKIISKNNIEVLYSSAPNYSSHILALMQIHFTSARLFWIAEFRDPWTFNPFRSSKPYLLDKIDHYLEKIVAKRSHKIIVTSEVYKEKFLEKYKFLTAEKVECIPNGFDADDFMDIEIVSKNNNDKIKILHAGNFYGKRSVKPFLVALDKFKDEYPDLADRLSVIQYGTVDPIAVAYLNEHPSTIFNSYAAIPHKKSLYEVCNADWLLLVPGPGAGTTTGKIYEYIASKNPVICLANEGTAKDIINELNMGYAIEVDDVNQIVDALKDIASDNAKYFRRLTDDDAIKKYDRRVIAEKVAGMVSEKFSG